MSITSVRIVAVSAIGLSLSTIPLVFGSFGVLLKPVADAFGWSRTDLGIGLTWHVAGIILASPIAGRLIDHVGPRRTIVISAPLYAAAFAIIGLLPPSKLAWYASFFAVAVLGTLASPIAYTKIIAQHFSSRRGLALGLALSGVGLGTAIIPVVASLLLQVYSWRSVFIALGLLSALVVAPTAKMFLPDADQCGNEGLRENQARQAVTGVTLAAMLQSRQFVFVVLAFLLVGLSYTGTVTQLVPHLTDQGMSLIQAAAIQSTLGFSVIFGRIATGLLLDVVTAKFVAAIAVITTALGIGLLIFLPAGWITPIAAVMLGLSAGAEIDVMAYLISRYFGLIRFSTLFGIANTAYFIGAAIGPAFSGNTYEISGDYQLAGWVFITALVVSASLFLFSDKSENSYFGGDRI